MPQTRCTVKRKMSRDVRPWMGGWIGSCMGHWRSPLLILLALWTCALVLLSSMAVPLPTLAQVTPFDWENQAPVVVDGRVVFEVRDTDSISAERRAQRINAVLDEEVRSPTLAEIEVVQDDFLIYLQSEHTNQILTTITDADVIDPRRNAYDQAVIWANELEDALRRGQLERRPIYLRRAALYSVLVIIGAIAIYLILQLVGHLVSRRLEHWIDDSPHVLSEWKRPVKLFWQLGLLGIQAGLWFTVLFYITDTFPQARSWRYQIINFLTARIIDLGSRKYSALELLLFLVFAIALWFAISLITQMFRLYVLNRAGVEQRMQDILGVLVQYALAFLGLIVLLQVWGIDVSTLTILASVLGVGLGFGVQNITNNFISGFIITVERPIQAGDFINVGDLVGTVERIGARSTEIRTLDQVTIIVPNSRFLESEVINWSHGDPVSRLRLPVGVAYGSNIERVKVALLEAVRRHPEVLLRPKPEVWFQGFGESALNFELMVWTGEPRKQFRVRSDLYYEIEASLRRHGVSVPFPQRDLHLRSPQLDALLDGLKQTTGLSGNGRLPDDSHSGWDALSADSEVPQLEPSQRPHFLEALDLDVLAETMRGDGGVTVGDRRYRLNLYPRCFTGGDAVEWLVQHKGYTREEAILVGQGLLQQGLISSVSADYHFRDGYYFYRFYQDERSLARLDESASPASKEWNS